VLSPGGVAIRMKLLAAGRTVAEDAFHHWPVTLMVIGSVMAIGTVFRRALLSPLVPDSPPAPSPRRGRSRRDEWKQPDQALGPLLGPPGSAH
jgi:hypothetical protein